MGLLDKVMFWKKKDEFDFDDFANKEMEKSSAYPPANENYDLQQKKQLGLTEKSPFPEEEAQHPTFNSPPASYPTAHYTGNSFSQSSPGNTERDLELISSKLDTIKAILTSMDQRISNLERAAGVPQQKERLW